jgi:hypothetical protein
MTTAELIFEDKQVFQDGSIIEMRIWRVPSPVLQSMHMFKYSLFYGHPGESLSSLITNAERGTTGTSEESNIPTASTVSSG